VNTVTAPAKITYRDWLTTVPVEITGDSLWKMEAYRLSLFMGELAWRDATKLGADFRTRSLSDQLYRAVGALAANVSEGYSRSSGKDRARFYEYALGSAREARGWYYEGRHILTDEVALHRMRFLTEVIRLLLTMVPQNREITLREEAMEYRLESSRTDGCLASLLSEIVPF
jgi:four helix bundle protein